MLFLVDANLPRKAAEMIRRRGHEAVDVRDTALGGAPDEDIARYAREQKMCVLTRDLGFADVRSYPPEDFGGLVVLRLPRTATAGTILRLLGSLLEQAHVVERLPGRLAIVEFGRVRFHPR